MDVLFGSIAAALATAFTIVLVDRWRARRSGQYAAWALSMGAFALGSAALAVGAAVGWNGLLFRTYYLFGAMLTVAWLGCGELLLVWGRSGNTVAVRRAVNATVTFTVVAVVTVFTTPLLTAVAADGVPKGSDLVGFWPRLLAVVSNSVGTVAVVVGAGWSIVRAVRDRSGSALVVGNGLIVLGVVLAASSGSFLGLGLAASKAVFLSLAELSIFVGYMRCSAPPTDRAPLRRLPTVLT
jgi:hypothetical protein